MNYPYNTSDAELALLQKISYACSKAMSDYVDSLSTIEEGDGFKTFTLKTKEDVAKYLQLQEANLEASKNIQKFYGEHPSKEAPEETNPKTKLQYIEEALDKSGNLITMTLKFGDKKIVSKMNPQTLKSMFGFGVNPFAELTVLYFEEFVMKDMTVEERLNYYFLK